MLRTRTPSGQAWSAYAVRSRVCVDRVAMFDIAVVLAFVACRTMTVWGRPVARFADTPGYETLDFSGSATRLWPVPLLYEVVTDDTWRVAVHVVLSSVAWLWLALEMRFLVPNLRRIAPFAVLLLGATPQVARWDLTILSESVGLSIAVAAFACWTHAMRTQSIVAWAAASGMTVLFGMTRTAQVPIMILVALIAVVAAYVTRLRTAVTVSAAIFAAGCVAALIMLSNNSAVSTLNFYTVLTERVVADPEARAWFTDIGMPWNDTYVDARSYVYRDDLSPELLEYLDLPVDQSPPELMLAGDIELAQWVRHDGWRTYGLYLATHLDDTITSATVRMDPLLDPTDATLLPLEPRIIVPRSMFGLWAGWLGAALLAITATIRRHRFDWRLAVPCTALVCAVPWFYINVYASGIEHPRHAITLAVILRIASLTAVLVGWDRLVVTPRPTRSSIAAEPELERNPNRS